MTVVLYFYHSSLEGASNRLVDFVLSCLQEEKVAYPSGMEEMLKDLLGNGEKLELALYKPTTAEKFENGVFILKTHQMLTQFSFFDQKVPSRHSAVSRTYTQLWIL